MPPDDAQDNFTDPESRIMKTSGGFDQCYNGRIAVDEASQLIVAAGLTNCAADNAELLPLIDQRPDDAGRARRREVLADAGYRGEATFQTLESRGITAYISIGHETRPAKPPNPAQIATERMAARLTSEMGRARYRRRKAIVEPVIGWIKEARGFRRFRLRGAAKARGEWNSGVPRREPEALTSNRDGVTRDEPNGGGSATRYPPRPTRHRAQSVRTRHAFCRARS